MTQEALKLALEALEYPLNQSHENFNVDMAQLISHRAIAAIKEAMAQERKPLEGVIDVQPIGYHSLQLIFKSQNDIAKFKATHDIKD